MGAEGRRRLNGNFDFLKINLLNLDIQTGQLRALLINLLSRCKHQPTIQTALGKFGDFMKGVDLVPDLRSAIFGTAARTNDLKVVEDLKKTMQACNFSEVERACIIGIPSINYFNF